MQKIKHRHTADCVVGGFRYLEGEKGDWIPVAGTLRCRRAFESRWLHIKVFMRATDGPSPTLLAEHEGGTGVQWTCAPGGPSRRNGGKSKEWIPLKPDLVVEVAYNHFTSDRFRHGTQFLRWRPDKKAAKCTIDQIDRRKSSALNLLGKCDLWLITATGTGAAQSASTFGTRAYVRPAMWQTSIVPMALSAPAGMRPAGSRLRLEQCLSLRIRRGN